MAQSTFHQPNVLREACDSVIPGPAARPRGTRRPCRGALGRPPARHAIRLCFPMLSQGFPGGPAGPAGAAQAASRATQNSPVRQKGRPAREPVHVLASFCKHFPCFSPISGCPDPSPRPPSGHAFVFISTPGSTGGGPCRPCAAPPPCCRGEDPNRKRPVTVNQYIHRFGTVPLILVHMYCHHCA